MKRALITGSFDPPTRGHLDLIKRTAAIFDEVVVCISVNSEKKYMYSLARRKEMIDVLCRGIENVSTDTNEGLVAYYARDHKIDVIVKGARTGADFEYELLISRVNKSMYDIETLLIPTNPEFAHISSLVAREMIIHGGNIGEYLTDDVVKLL